MSAAEIQLFLCDGASPLPPHPCSVRLTLLYRDYL